MRSTNKEQAFHRRDDALWVEERSVESLAKAHGTPLYLYSRHRLESNCAEIQEAFGPLLTRLFYAVKACSNLAILRRFREWGCGFDVVSRGEIDRCLRAGAAPADLVFAGVGKTRDELSWALEAGVGAVHVESFEEAFELDELAGIRSMRAPVLLRVNPDVDAGTHHYITTGTEVNKFGIPAHELRTRWDHLRRLENLDVKGFHVHIGSQVKGLEPFAQAAKIAADLVREGRHQGFTISALNIGGGLPVAYRGEHVPTPAAIVAAIRPHLKPLQVDIFLEPGRFLVADAGILVTKVVRIKRGSRRSFLVVDAGMNDLIRPALYGADHEIVAVTPKATGKEERFDIVGPLCESGDFLGLDRTITDPVAGDLLAVLTAGAYGFTMASNYNSRGRAAEVLVDGERDFVIRRRETIEDLMAPESLGE